MHYNIVSYHNNYYDHITVYFIPMNDIDWLPFLNLLAHLFLILSYLHILSYPIISYAIISYLIISYSFLSYDILSHSILLHHILSDLALFYPIVSYHILKFALRLLYNLTIWCIKALHLIIITTISKLLLLLANYCLFDTCEWRG